MPSTQAKLFMLDTNIISLIARGGSANLRERIARTDMVSTCMSVITEAELRYGLARKPQATALKMVVHELMLRIESLPWESATAEIYASLRADLEARGTPLANLDTQIAAHALETGCVLITNDKAFRQVRGLQVEDWSS